MQLTQVVLDMYGRRIGVSIYGVHISTAEPLLLFRAKPIPATPTTAAGLESNWVHGHTNAQGEVQRFEMPDHVIPTFRDSASFGELKPVLPPRWYLAFRGGFSTMNTSRLNNWLLPALVPIGCN